MALLFDDISISTIIGAGSSFKGDLSVSGAVMIDGDLDGDLQTTGNIIIGESARVRGNISAKSAVVNGIVLGDISAPEGIKLNASSAVIGDITTRKLQIASGVVFHGHCIALFDETSFEAETRRQNELREIKSKSIIK